MTTAYNMISNKGNRVVNQITTISENERSRQVDFYSGGTHIISMYMHKSSGKINIHIDGDAEHWTHTTSKYAKIFLNDNLANIEELDLMGKIKKIVKGEEMFIEVENINLMLNTYREW